jgi:hypothetical protein
MVGHDRQRSSKAVQVAGQDQRHERRVRCCSAVVDRTQDDDPAVCADGVGAKIGEVEVSVTNTRFSDTAAGPAASTCWRPLALEMPRGPRWSG